MATKLRVTLTTKLLEAIATNEELNYTFKDEITRIVKPALFKVGIGAVKTITTRELTLEEKVKRNIATDEELDIYEQQLMAEL